MRNKIKTILSILLIGIMFGAIPAVATTGTTIWGGNGADSVRTCNSGEAPFLHWQFQRGGVTLNSVMLTLNVSASELPARQMQQSGGGAFSNYTGFYNPNTLSGTHVDYDYSGGNSGNGNGGVLTISEGCTGRTEVPEFPMIALPIAAIIGLVFIFQHKKRK